MPIFVALVAVTIFATVAGAVRAVDWGGAVAGWAIALILYLAGGLGAFLALVGVFLCAWLTTLFGAARKRQLGVAEKKKGRSANQIVANLLVAAVCVSVAVLKGPTDVWYLGALAALAEAAADTTASEIGMAFGGQPRLITTFKRVPVGMDGGITFLGTAAAVPAALFIGVIAVETGFVSSEGDALIACVAGVLGMLLDSLLGALFQRRRWLNNDSVNLLGTASAAAIVLSLIRPRF